MTPYWALAMAIAAEVLATTALKATDAFTKPLASMLVIVGYAIAFYGLSVAIKSIPVGVAYGIWSGMGVVLVSVLAFLIYKQSLSTVQIIGLAMIVVGVVVVNLKA
jgi:small multidrug resistance pump